MAMNPEPHRPTLVLGPVPYLWDPAAWRDFYHRIADEADVDTVVVGETVCSKRLHFFDALLDGVVDRLVGAGKSVRLASLALVTLGRELQLSRRLAGRGLPVEVSELSAHAAMTGQGHTMGPLVNVYNAATARVLARGCATSICLPPELPLAAVHAIAGAVPEIGFEVQAFGRVPLAISARCAHARVKGQTRIIVASAAARTPTGLSSIPSTVRNSWRSTACRPCRDGAVPSGGSAQAARFGRVGTQALAAGL